MKGRFRNDPGSSENLRPIGQAWLRRELGLGVPAPAVRSYIGTGIRQSENLGSRTLEFYPRHYAIDEKPISHLRFALRHEPVDLGVIIAALKAVEPGELEDWVRAEPTGGPARRCWFLFETFTGKTLDVENARSGNYVAALDPDKHIVADRRNSRRHRVSDNLLGGAGLCPTVRRTPRLLQQMGVRVDREAQALISSYDQHLLTRALSFLYTKETRSSFAIEGERPGPARTSRFIAALEAAPGFDPSDQAALIALQGAIVDARYAATGWRNFQNFIGETVAGFRQEVHFVCPRPDDVADLMAGWMALTRRVVESDVDAVVAAAISAFAFVFIHPFEDGNGRIHRFLMHHVLARRGYSPPGVIFPVSAAIERDRSGYDAVLDSFSKPLAEFVQWGWTEGEHIAVQNDTGDLYRYFDATVFAEYLYDRVTDTVRRDLTEELAFLAVFDGALAGVRTIVDMPDRRAALFVRLCLQNGGSLSKAKRPLFPELTAAEIAAMETAIQAARDR